MGSDEERVCEGVSGDESDSNNAATGTAEESKVVPIRPNQPRPRLDPRLEEMRHLLRDIEPLGDELSGERVIEDEKLFRKRFGIGFDWPRRHRQALIELKHDKDLTDAEIKLFRHTGNLRRTPFGVHLGASRWVALWGGLQLALFGTLLVGVVIPLAPLVAGSPIKALKLGGVAITLVSLCWVIYLFYIAPWRIQRRTEQRLYDSTPRSRSR